MSEEIIWKEPPPARVGQPHNPEFDRIVPFVDALRQEPGRWALFGERMSQSVMNRMRGVPGLKVSGRTVSKGGQEYDIYAKWVGDADS